uniref:zinc finger HIT domain-containing protein 3 n=1 Tax=Myxine glutinosa TaxID=7769 RepID=UPI00358EE25B
MCTKGSLSCGFCVVCDRGPGVSYRCPHCTSPYCSLACYKQHKDACTDDSKIAASLVPEENVLNEEDMELGEDESSDRVPPSCLARLAQSEPLLLCLRDSFLRSILRRLDSLSRDAELCEEAICDAMAVPGFKNFADVCLKVVDADAEVNKET